MVLFGVREPDAGATTVTFVEWQWTATGRMNVGRYSHTATLLLDGRVLVTGGVANEGVTATAEVYDPATGEWSAVGVMITPRTGHTATRLTDGRVLVVGGSLSAEPLASAELFEPATGEWSAAMNMSEPRAGHSAVLLSDGDVLVIGGYDGHETKSYSMRYHPATDTWTEAEPMKKARSDHSAAELLDGRVLVAGGYLPGNVAELYDSTTGMWRYTGGRFADFPGWNVATRLDDGRVMVTGENAAALYDPNTESWTGGYTGWQMLGHASAMMGDGRMMISGGYDVTTIYPYEPGYLQTTYIYDPISSGWTYGGLMTDFRVDHTATRLLDGRVLVAGGLTSGALDSAELFAPYILPIVVYLPSVMMGE
jgi:hypothetical protein